MSNDQNEPGNEEKNEARGRERKGREQRVTIRKKNEKGCVLCVSVCECVCVYVCRSIW